MDKFVNIKDGSVFYAKAGTIQHDVLVADKDYELEEKTEAEEKTPRGKK